MMEVRVLTTLDAADYLKLRLEALQQDPDAFATTYQEMVSRDNSRQTVEKNLSSLINFTFGAYDNEQLLGVVTLLPETYLKLKHKATIVAMYVSPQERKLGVGKKLIQAALNKATELEIEQINLTVVSKNEAAKLLYTSMGFKLYGTEIRAVKQGDIYLDEDLMVLFLN